MEYDLTKTVEGHIGYDVGDDSPFGEMAPSMLMAKFEETNIAEDEYGYDNYARTTLTNWGPDENKFEHEEPRGGVNRNAGYLQLRYNGHRGEGNGDPYRPEIFDGFMGNEDRDPRGINVDPDFKQLRSQLDERMRFVNWTPDQCDHITGGGRSEGKLMADQQKLHAAVKNRLKVFDRQIDGRRNGLRREFQHRSHVEKQITVQSYGDLIKDYALNPQRRANLIAKQIIRDSREFRDETLDGELYVAKYSQICRRRATKDGHQRVAEAQKSTDAEFSDADATRSYKTAGLLMANIVKGKKQIMNNTGDIDMADAKLTATAKTAPFVRDLNLITQAIATDGKFSEGDDTRVGKTANPVQRDHLARQQTCNHVAPAHHYLNAEILFKSVKPGADTRKIKNLVITDATSAQAFADTRKGKAAALHMKTGTRLTTDDTDKGESVKTVNYRAKLCPNGDRRIRVTSGDRKSTESDLTQSRQVNHQNYRITDQDDVQLTSLFGENQQKERMGGVMGSKYMNRFIERDGRTDDITATGADV